MRLQNVKPLDFVSRKKRDTKAKLKKKKKTNV